jgi:hypothetical protein
MKEGNVMDKFTLAYIEAALWSSHDDNDNYFDENYTLEDISEETLNQIINDCQKFQNDNKTLLEGLDLELCGHDFLLTRNHHGAGFWDRGLGKLGDRLTEESEKYKEIDLYIGDNNKIYC